MNFLKELLSSKINIFLIIFIIVVITFIFNFKLIIGFGDSMLPTISNGTPLLCKYQDEFEVDDIVFYEVGNAHVVHRIIEKHVLDNDFGKIEIYYAKGDNNPQIDPFPLTNTNIKCRILTF